MPCFADVLATEIAARRGATRPSEAQAPCPNQRSLRDLVSAARVAPCAPDRVAAAKRRFRQRALATHPDRGGSAAAFIEAVRAFDREVASIR